MTFALTVCLLVHPGPPPGPAAAPAAPAQDWPVWRGPGARGVCGESGLPESCSIEKNLEWKHRLSGDYKASPVGGDGKIYFLNMEGDCEVLRAGGTHQPLADNHLDGIFIATPAISGGRIYLRSKDRLYADKRG